MQPIDFYSKPYEWSIGVATIAKDNALPYILIHKYGHYISLNDPDLTIVTDFNKLSFEGGELLQSFVAQCDGHIAEELNNINQNNHYLFCARHKDDFVSKYAATNLLDDFAESFAHFVMGTSYDSDVLKRKMKFFEDRPEIVKIKNQILNNLKENNMGEIVAATQ